MSNVFEIAAGVALGAFIFALGQLLIAWFINRDI